jgi:hypothetical protein
LSETFARECKKDSIVGCNAGRFEGFVSRVKTTKAKAEVRQPLGVSPGESAARPFAEAPAWKAVGRGWRPLFGSYRDLGFSFEWHEFTAKEEFDWAQSFHPGSVEVCLNLAGTGKLSDGRQTVELLPQTFAFYFQGQPSLTATRKAGEEHRFITIEFSPDFLSQHFSNHAESVHPIIGSLVAETARESFVITPDRLAVTLHQLVESLRHCPVFTPAKEMWFRSKALEVAAHLFFRPADGELLCTRTQRLARERGEKA